MLTIEGAMQGDIIGFTTTSSKMNSGRPAKLSLAMSPIMSDGYQNPSCNGGKLGAKTEEWRDLHHCRVKF